MTETYDGIEWGIDEMPIGSSTPDDLFELSYRASATCPDCGTEISGIANFHSHNDDMTSAYLAHIDYTQCECEDESDDDYDYEDDEPDDLESILNPKN